MHSPTPRACLLLCELTEVYKGTSKGRKAKGTHSKFDLFHQRVFLGVSREGWG